MKTTEILDVSLGDVNQIFWSYFKSGKNERSLILLVWLSSRVTREEII